MHFLETPFIGQSRLCESSLYAMNDKFYITDRIAPWGEQPRNDTRLSTTCAHPRCHLITVGVGICNALTFVKPESSVYIIHYVSLLGIIALFYNSSVPTQK